MSGGGRSLRPSPRSGHSALVYAAVSAIAMHALSRGRRVPHVSTPYVHALFARRAGAELTFDCAPRAAFVAHECRPTVKSRLKPLLLFSLTLASPLPVPLSGRPVACKPNLREMFESLPTIIKWSCPFPHQPTNCISAPSSPHPLSCLGRTKPSSSSAATAPSWSLHPARGGVSKFVSDWGVRFAADSSQLRRRGRGTKVCCGGREEMPVMKPQRRHCTPRPPSQSPLPPRPPPTPVFRLPVRLWASPQGVTQKERLLPFNEVRGRCLASGRAGERASRGWRAIAGAREAMLKGWEGN
jgi:hypothetical protein